MVGSASRRHPGSCLLLLTAFLAPTTLAAQQPSGEVPSHECCLELLLPVGARAAALGNSLEARSSSDGTFGNPAALATLDSSAFVVDALPSSAGQTMALSMLVPVHGIGAFGASYMLVDYGDIPSTNTSQIQTGSISMRVHVLVGSFATNVGAGFSAGVNYGVYLQRLQCTGECTSGSLSSSTETVDAGVRYVAPAPLGLELGASLRHLGLPLQVNNAVQSDPPPTRLHVAAAYELLRHFHADPSLALWLTGELDAHWPAVGSVTPGVGAELSAGDAIFVRAGYSGGDGGCASGPAVGVGLHYHRFRIALAKSYSACSFASNQTPAQATFQLRF